MIQLHKTAPVTDLGHGVERRVLAHAPELMSVEVRFATGAVGAVHTHPHSQISYVLCGRFRATVGGECRTIATGDTYYVAPEEPHGVVCLEAGALLDVFTPAREDFLP